MIRIDVKKEILKFVAKINERNPYYLMIGVLALVLILDYFLIMQFQLGAIRRLGPRVSEIRDDFKEFETNRDRVDNYRADIQDLNRSLKELDQQIKTTDQIPLVLETFSRIANRNKVFVEQLLPDSTLGTPALKNAEGKYYFLPMVVAAKSSYHNLGRFLNELEQEGALMQVDGITISGNAGNPRQHQVKLSVKVVVLEPKGVGDEEEPVKVKGKVKGKGKKK